MTQLIEGVGATYGDGTSPQQALEEAGAGYKRRYGCAPTHAALPTNLDPKSLQLWTLIQVEPYGSANMIIVGKLQSNEARQLELF